MTDAPNTVLIIDDTPSSLEVASDCLVEAGFDILVAQDGLSGLDIAHQVRPDLILLDVMMPGVDGLETCRRLKADPNTRNIPVIFMTALSDTEHKVGGFEVGGVDYITKPFQVSEVLARVQTHLALQSIQNELTRRNDQLEKEIHERQRAEDLLREAHDQLESRVTERTLELELANVHLTAEIEERKQAEDALRRTEKDKNLILNSTRDLVIYHDTTLATRWANQAAADAVGATPEDMVGRYCWEIWHHRDRPCDHCPLLAAHEARAPREGEITSRDGHTWWIRGYPVMNRDDDIVAMVEFGQDITRRKASEAKIQRRNRELALLNGVIAASVSVTRPRAVLEIACRELAMAFNLSRVAALLLNEEEDRLDSVAEYVPPERPAPVDALPKAFRVREFPNLQQLIRQKEVMTVTAESTGGTGIPPFHLGGTRSLLLVPLIDRERVTGCFVLEIDDTGRFDPKDVDLARSVAQQVSGVMERLHIDRERRDLETQYFQAQKMEALGKLTGGVAHDFNNILTIIMGVADMIGGAENLPPRIETGLQQIQTASQRAALLVRQLLAFSRQQVLKPQILNLNDIVTSIDQLLQRILGEDIAIEIRRDPSLGQAKADQGQIEQVIMNLVVNARDAMPQGGTLTIETANADLDESYTRYHVGVASGPHVMLAVSDTGTGMDADTQAHIFEPFFTTKPKEEGTGLGLSTVHGIINQSGGHIWVYSEPNHGTTFKIYLPRVQAPRDAVAPRTVPRKPRRGSETILVVEDDAIVRRLVHEMLTHFDYRVLDADCGATARTVCAQHDGPIHLMLSDVVMPGGESGLQLAEALSADYPGMKVLFMSGYTENAIVHHGILDDGVSFIQKPFMPEDLARKVRETLDAEAPGEGKE